MLAILLQAIMAASRPDSTSVLTEKHLHQIQKQKHIDTKPRIIPKKTKRMKGVFEHKDTPIHHH